MDTVGIILGVIIIILVYKFFQSPYYEEVLEDNKKNKKVREIFKEQGIANPNISSFTLLQKNKVFELYGIRSKLVNTFSIGKPREEALIKAGYIISEFPSDFNLQVIKAKTFTDKEKKEGFLYTYSFITHKTSCYKINNNKASQYPLYTTPGVNVVSGDLVSVWEGVFAKNELKKIDTAISEFYLLQRK